MKKSCFLLAQALVLVLGLGMSVTSCKDDDKDDNKSQQPAELADPLDTDEARVAWRWLSQLTQTQSLTTDWATKTYEPTVGIASENNELTRIVICVDIDDARQHFASLADIDEDKLSTEQTISQSGVGKMTWTPSKSGAQNLAEVSVDSKLLPKLAKIVYCTKEQTGLNGIFWSDVKGTAYYRFGDVVRDEQGYYWVCVRPAFEEGDKEDSHWINVFNASESGNYNGVKVPFPQENIYSKYNGAKKYNEQTILLPTKLKYDRKHIYNLNNLIWAMLNPAQYEKEAKDKKGLGGFKYTYHSRKFIENVNKFWDKTDDNGLTVWENVFGYTRAMMESMQTLYFFYQGYKWWIGNDATLWVYESTGYEPKMKGSESGDKQSWKVVEQGFDIRHFAGDPSAQALPFDRNRLIGKGYWVVRYKNGKELSKSGAYKPDQPIPGVTPVCRYNEYTNTAAGSDLETEGNVKNEDLEQREAKVGYVIGKNGKFYRTSADARACNTTPLCVIVYVSPEVNGSRKPIEEGFPNYYGMAMGIEDIGANVWCNEGDEKQCTNYKSQNALQTVWDFLYGLTTTMKLQAGCDKGHVHPFTKCLDEYTQKFNPTDATTYNNISQWFIPCVGQLKLAFENMGLKVDMVEREFTIFDPDGKKTAFQKVKDFLGNNADVLQQGNTVNSESHYWTVTEVDNYSAWTLCVMDDGTMRFAQADKNTTIIASVRPFILFGKRNN